MSAPQPPPSPPHLDPPFRGYIETTYDSLLVFEAARKGLIPRVTRRLIERERGMVQSGAVFVFDEQESGIKRWTDGLVWSPSRILGNFLVYRETDKRPINGTGSPSDDQPEPQSGYMTTPNPAYAESSHMALQSSQSTGEIPIMAQGAIRQRSASEGGMDRQRERQLVGSLTNSYKFREGGLVKKTMSVNIGNYSQHMISYYTVEDVMSGKLRTPSTIPELAALEISVDYLQKQNFRFPPVVEYGLDGIPRYRGEAEEPMSPNTPLTGFSIHSLPTPSDPYDAYNQSNVHLSMDPPRHAHSRNQSHLLLQQPPTHTAPPGYMAPPGSAGSGYFDPNYHPGSAPAQPIPIQRQVSSGGSGPHRPNSSRSRFDPYGQSNSPRGNTIGLSPVHNMHHHPGPPSAGLMGTSPGNPSPGSINRRQSVPHQPTQYQQYHQPYPHHQPSTPLTTHQQPPADYYQQYDIKPNINPTSGVASYTYQPPASAPGAFAEYYTTSAPAMIPLGPPSLSVSITQVGSPVNAYTPITGGPPGSAHGHRTPSSGGLQHQQMQSQQQQQYTTSGGGAGGPTWQTAPLPSAPGAGSQSRLIPAQPRDYGRSPTSAGSMMSQQHQQHHHQQHQQSHPPSSASSAGRHITSPRTSLGVNQANLGPPSSSGSGNSSVGMIPGGAGSSGGEFAYSVPPQQQPNQSGQWSSGPGNNGSGAQLSPPNLQHHQVQQHGAGIGGSGGGGLHHSTSSSSLNMIPESSGLGIGLDVLANGGAGAMQQTASGVDGSAGLLARAYIVEDGWANSSVA